jgi:hypothetical protein
MVITGASGKAANNPKASVPWKLIAEDPDKFFDNEYLPDGVQLIEISKMKADTLQACYRHWCKSQDIGEDAFVFKHVHEPDVRADVGKKKCRAADDDDDEEDNGHASGSAPPKKKHASSSTHHSRCVSYSGPQQS